SASSLPKCAIATADTGLPVIRATNTMSGALDKAARSAIERDSCLGIPALTCSSARAARARWGLRIAHEPAKLRQRHILDCAVQAKLRRASDLAIERVDRRIEIEKA